MLVTARGEAGIEGVGPGMLISPQSAQKTPTENDPAQHLQCPGAETLLQHYSDKLPQNPARAGTPSQPLVTLRGDAERGRAETSLGDEITSVYPHPPGTQSRGGGAVPCTLWPLSPTLCSWLFPESPLVPALG